MVVVLKRGKNEEVEAGKRFVANMQNPAFVSGMLRDVGVERPPCFCCLHQMQKTCTHGVGEFDCKDYVLYSRSPQKVEIKFLDYLHRMLSKRDQKKKIAA